jgi:hypothetical protein
VNYLAIFALSILAAIPTRAAQCTAPEVLAEMNLARTQPQTYARIIQARMAGYRGIEGDRAVKEAIRFLERAKPLRPLAGSAALDAAATSRTSGRAAS